MIVLFTDFGLTGPYTGQMKAVLHREAQGVPVVDLFADAPAFRPRAAAYLLAAYVGEFPPGTVFLCVVDPGVGTDQRQPVTVAADGRWFVGPDNGLFNVIVKRAGSARRWPITWRPERLSQTFHGRDLFAPVAACLARGELPEGDSEPFPLPAWPDDLAEIIYTDHYGNAMTGLRASGLARQTRLEIEGHVFSWAPTFGAVAAGDGFWYENSSGLAEIAVSGGSAVEAYGLRIGDSVTIRNRHWGFARTE